MANQFSDGRFRFAVGIEDTFVPQVSLGRRALDEYELTQHYHFWFDDLGLAREAGATTIRYGLPWYRINPRPGVFVWEWVDRVVDRLEELGLEAIVDLMHYGTPLWLDNQFLNHAYPEVVAEYGARVAERYRGRLTAYTPLNEPLVNAAFCGESGTWPPHLTGHDGYVKLARALVRGIVATQRAIADVTTGEATFVHVEATLRFQGAVEAFTEEVELLRERAFLVEDLLTGRVDEAHPLASYLRANGFGDDDFAWSLENTASPDVMGVNYYPHLSTAELVAGEALTPMGPVTPQARETGGLAGLEEAVRVFAERYGRPVFLTETSMVGNAEQRIRWLDQSLELLLRLRREGIDVVGYTWWPLFHYVDWAYREASGTVDDHLVPMGLYDLRPTSVGVLERAHTAVVERFRAHASGEVGAPAREVGRKDLVRQG